jgi:ATP-dependent Clp protease ATP-binding subunit ClpC
VIGRQREIERVVQILGRRTKNNPILVGPPGVGKTAIAEGLAQRIVNQDVPELLQDKRVISLNLGLLLAGTQFRGAFEERLSQVLAEVREDGNTIVVIDEVHTLVGAGATEGGLDAANLLKPALARGELQCIGATTLDEYRQSIEADAALERRFQPVMVKEPTVAETTEILMGLRQRYEDHHQLTIRDDALTAAASLSARYISDRFLPDKAIDLVDEASSRVRLRHASKSAKKVVQQHLAMARQNKADALAVQDFEQASQARDQEMALEAELKFLMVERELTQENRQAPIVTTDDIAEVVSASTGIPVNRLTEVESRQLLNLEETLHQFVIGQDAAVNAAAKAIRRARLGLKGSNRPIASFVFCGPTGVGKTELAKALATSVFGSVDAMVRLDMSEYMERQSLSKLIGSPPGYVGYGDGGQLTEPIRRKPYTLILLDEIEKAHPDVFNVLLQVLEDGRLTDAQGRVVNFQNTLIVMTSNLGAPTIQKSASRLGFELLDQNPTAAHDALMQSQVTEALKLFFRPEFMNRLDDVIVFQSLSREDIKQVADLFLAEVATRLAERNIALEVPEAIKDLLVAKGYDSAYGARPMRRAITRWVEDPLAEAILAGKLEPGDTAILVIDDDGQIGVSAKVELPLAQVKR